MWDQFPSQSKSMRSKLEIDFEDDEKNIRIQEWKIHAQIIETQKDYSMEAEEFIDFNTEFVKLKIKKHTDFQTEWYQSYKIEILDTIDKITNSRNKAEIIQI